ncbi:N-acetylglucosaminidase [Paenibacillus terrae]|uniref:von Willebrand factor A n=1 Tax=Paenibacillus terrae TaxID=159743 RepID=A0A0D7X959_9BACL|nr:glucosaminidase domain-containing protein [Paenibacillus terrae]KJD47553.1 von Willebrand factor A [Paenibacillus terrae]
MKWKEPTFGATPMLKALTAANAHRKAKAFDLVAEQKKQKLNYPDWAQTWMRKYKEEWYIAKANGDEVGMRKAQKLAEGLRSKLREMATFPKWAQEQMKKETIRWMTAEASGNIREKLAAEKAGRAIREKLGLIDTSTKEPPKEPVTNKSKDDPKTEQAPPDKSENDSFEAELAKFPESYRPALLKLHKQHPSWRFIAEETNVDFNSFLNAEMKNGLVCTEVSKYGYSPPWRDPKFKYDRGYNAASPKAVSYFLDPRNFLTESRVFQFLSGKYDKNTQNKEAVNKVLSKSLANKGDVFLKAGGNEASAVFLAAKAMVESGGGTSTLGKGQVPEYIGWYNMYGIGANDGSALKNGAKKAKSENWNSVDSAIIGGGKWIYRNYIQTGQDTLYSLKWNVNSFRNNGTVSKQYATNIMDAYVKSDRFSKGLKTVDAPLTFRIPVYKNMPATACPEPTQVSSR